MTETQKTKHSFWTIKKVFFLCLIVLLSIKPMSLWIETKTSVEDRLVKQLEGTGRCHFRLNCDEKSNCTHCSQSTISELYMDDIGLPTLRNLKENCQLNAIRCISTRKDKVMLPHLLAALETTRDIQTCDGSIPLRASLIAVIAQLGDQSAIAPLQKYVSSNPIEAYSSGAYGCKAGPEDTRIASDAIRFIQDRQDGKKPNIYKGYEHLYSAALFSVESADFTQQ